MEHNQEHEKLAEQAKRVKQEMDAKNVFLFVFNPGEKTDHVVAYGELDVISTVKMIHALCTLQERLEKDLQEMAMKRVHRDRAHMSN